MNDLESGAEQCDLEKNRGRRKGKKEIQDRRHLAGFNDRISEDSDARYKELTVSSQL